MAGHRLEPRLPDDRPEAAIRAAATPSVLRRACRRIPTAFVIALSFIASQYCLATESRQPIPIAIIDFDYFDTSGEVRDATAEHETFLKAFMGSIRNDLASSGKYRVVDVACGTGPCTVAGSTPTQLLEEAKRAGARLLLFGGIHKESTLVQWAKVTVVDMDADKLIVDRLLTFRGDSEEAWRRAEAFIVEDLREVLPSE